MLNKLDNKLILDRQFAVELLDCLDVNDPDHGQVAKKLREIMSVQDNTGWVAVPVEATADMFERICEAGGSDDWDGIWPDALNASPPLPGGGE
jgi:hypothetical protein